MIMLSCLPLFLHHTSASMNQRTYLGTSLFIIAKASVETVLKVTTVKFRRLVSGSEHIKCVQFYSI